ncbi:hypothetical protein V6Z11_A10G022200 [Gossypium hirsutum]
MNEALLLATMYILGLPVDVHLTDGSVYAGIFHTAAVEKEFGNNRECPEKEKEVEGEEDAENVQSFFFDPLTTCLMWQVN